TKSCAGDWATTSPSAGCAPATGVTCSKSKAWAPPSWPRSASNWPAGAWPSGTTRPPGLNSAGSKNRRFRPDKMICPTSVRPRPDHLFLTIPLPLYGFGCPLVALSLGAPGPLLAHRVTDAQQWTGAAHGNGRPGFSQAGRPKVVVYKVL